MTGTADLEATLATIRDVAEGAETAFDRAAGPFRDRIVLYGAGNLGRKTCSGLRRVRVEPLAFADADRSLHGRVVEGLPVLSPEEAARSFGDSAVFVVTVWSPGRDRRFSVLRDFLLQLGCINVTWFLPLFWKHPDVFLPHFRLEAPKRIAANAGPIRDAFGLLSDEISKCEYLAQLRLLVSAGGALEELPPLPEGPIYFPADIIRIEALEVFLDCGAYDGDTIRSFLNRARGGFSRILAFEPDSASARRLAESVSLLESGIDERIAIHASAVCGVTGRVRFAAGGGEGSAVCDAGESFVESVALDDLPAAESATFIKLDIEGLEMDALRGAKGLISRRSPLMAVCVYHVADHLWSVPLLLSEFSGRYRFFLRRHADEFTEVVCYAVPIDRAWSSARGVPEA